MTSPAPVTPTGSSSPVGGARRKTDLRKLEGSAHRTMRYRDDSGFEAKCLYCREWWPLTLEYWRPKGGLARCASCWTLYKRLNMAGRRADELIRAARNQAGRVRYHANKAKSLEAARVWRAKNKAHIAEYNRAYRARNPERSRAESAAYYAEARDVILLKKRAAYRAKAAA